MKRFITVLLGVALAASLIIACATPGRGPTGVFTGSAPGHGGTMLVEVELNRGNIRRIDVVQHNETRFFYEVPFQRIIGSIVSGNNLNVDNVAGATLTSMALRASITDALVSAGANIRAMTRPVQRPAGGQTIQKQADVVVVGGGGAGMTAAIRASQLGASVIVLEKLAFIGGNTLISGSGFNAVNPRIQLAQNPPVNDSIDFHFQQTFEGGDSIADPTLVRILVENALAGIYWTQELGMQWQDNIFTVPGALFRRSNLPVMPLGIGFVDMYRRFLDRADSNIELLLETRATELITEGGRVVGVRATNADNNTVEVRAASVVMATGGFGSNIEMRMRYDQLWHVLDRGIPTTNLPSIVGDGIVMGQAVGANLVGMDYIQLLPFGHIRTGSLSGLVGRSMEDHVYVNIEGRRFVDEGARRDDMTAATLAQTNSTMFVIIDSRSVPTGDVLNFFGEAHDSLVNYGHVYRANTLEELARLFGADPATFVQTINEFNASVDRGYDHEFGRTVFSGRIEQPPFYAGPRMPTVHHTMGGLQIDAYTRVISTTGAVIPGLYAAGEVAGGIHGTNRLGGNALTEMTVFGKIAGESAALRR
ncbi:MAG: flavocytochrome c [Defluviitaleaceae bacterium]|nr:flavocytochrome c [Defluviitaleaceae bacterium]